MYNISVTNGKSSKCYTWVYVYMRSYPHVYHMFLNSCLTCVENSLVIHIWYTWVIRMFDHTICEMHVAHFAVPYLFSYFLHLSTIIDSIHNPLLRCHEFYNFSRGLYGHYNYEIDETILYLPFTKMWQDELALMAMYLNDKGRCIPN